jgi:hypothetical protein
VLLGRFPRLRGGQRFHQALRCRGGASSAKLQRLKSQRYLHAAVQLAVRHASGTFMVSISPFPAIHRGEPESLFGLIALQLTGLLCMLQNGRSR